MKSWLKWLIGIGVLILIVVIGVGIWGLQNKPKAEWYISVARNWWRYRGAPAGTLETQTAPNASPTTAAGPPVNLAAYDTGKDWASYNKTLTSDRFSALNQINRSNVSGLRVLCSFDTGQHTGFNSGLVEVDGKLLFATTYDTYAIDPNNCHQIWHAHESYKPATVQNVDRGVAVMDGRVFRGTEDGRVIAYELATGKRLWATKVADPKKAESTPAAPIAWNGMVFIGTAGGDMKDVRGRMYGLDAATGKVKWEFYLVPKQPADPQYGPEAPSPLNGSSWQNAHGVPITGGGTWTSYTLDPKTGLLYVPGGNPAPDFAQGVRTGQNLLTGSIVVLDAKTGTYRGDFKLVPIDWHDYDVSSAPVLIHTAAGHDMLMEAPKDGNLYAIDLSANKLAFKLPVTRIENPRVPFSPGTTVHFCPGTVGGAEWNGPGYDPADNLVMVGEVDWCDAVKVQRTSAVSGVENYAPWSGEDSPNPYNTWGHFDPPFDWAGWVYAVDPDTGKWRWRVRSNYPVESGITPTAGGIVFFGDLGGNFYALDSANGQKLWGSTFDGAVGGGVITYDTGQGQRVAIATGLMEVIWPTKVATGKVVVLGL